MVRSGMISALLVSGFALSTWSAPVIQFDTKEVQAGSVVAGKAEKVDAVFKVKNAGDAVLKLTEVRPGCGCTVVKYDSLIQPGQSAKIEASVNMKTYPPNTYKKYITVTSNAPNDSVERLTIEFTIQSIIEVSESNISFSAGDAEKYKAITLASKKNNLKIKDIVFIPRAGAADAFKQEQSLKFSLEKTDKPRSDGMHVYKLKIFRPKYSGTVSGQIVIKTNHADESEFTLQSDIRP